MEKQSWHLSKTLSLSIIITLITTMTGLVWAASSANSKLSEHEVWIQRHTVTSEEIKKTLKDIQIDIAVIKEKVKNL